MPLVIKELHIKITINRPLQGPQAAALSVADEDIDGKENGNDSSDESEREQTDNKNQAA